MNSVSSKIGVVSCFLFSLSFANMISGLLIHINDIYIYKLQTNLIDVTCMLIYSLIVVELSQQNPYMP